MLSNKTVIILYISMLSVSWIQATTDRQEPVAHEEVLSKFSDILRSFIPKSTPWSTTGQDQSSDGSASRSMKFMTDDSTPEEGSGMNDSFSGDGSDMDDLSTEEISHSPTLRTEQNFPEVTSPLPVTSIKDFIFEEPASTTVANIDKDTSEEIGSTGQSTLQDIIIVSGCVVILLLILLLAIKIYCLRRKTTQEKYGADKPFITIGNIITK